LRSPHWGSLRGLTLVGCGGAETAISNTTVSKGPLLIELKRAQDEHMQQRRKVLTN
jgi:hypothetical protein